MFKRKLLILLNNTLRTFKSDTTKLLFTHASKNFKNKLNVNTLHNYLFKININACFQLLRKRNGFST